MKYISLSLLLTLVAFACTPADKTTPPAPTTPSATEPFAVPVELPASFYKKLQGTVGDIAITMDLMRRDSTLTGTYFYEKVGLPLNLSGSLSATGAVTMAEYVGQGDETGSFEGRFSDAHTLTGEWISAANHKTLPFKLTEVVDGKPSITMEHFREENCATRDHYRKEAGRDSLGDMDPECSHIDVATIVVETGTPSVDAVIAAEILKTQIRIIFDEESRAGSNAPKTLPDYLHNIQKLELEGMLQRDQSVDIITNDRGILCISAGGYEYSGGAHGIGWIEYLNLDLETGKRLRLKDLLVPRYADRLNEIAAEIFFGLPDGGGILFDSEQSHFKLNDNFAITPGGLIFTFQPYEIAPYVAGMPEVRIPYTEMEDLIPAGGLLARIRRK